jgi:hypothetical protein
MLVRIPDDLPKGATKAQVAYHLSHYCFAVLPIALRPEEIGLRVTIPANIPGFDKYPLRLISSKPARFARLVRFVVERDGQSHGILVSRRRVDSTGNNRGKVA